MKEFKKILFPTDLSESTTRLIPFVKTMAKRFEAELHVLFVARVFQYFTSIYVPHPSINTFEKELIEGAEKRMDEFKEEYLADLPAVKTSVILGDAAEKILEYAKNEDMDMIIMGTHGRKGLDRVIFGSVAEKVVKMAPVPLFIINPYKV
jgi:nucleotide-binding universal stress UspA family protein